jgi:hypothetical protein
MYSKSLFSMIMQHHRKFKVSILVSVDHSLHINFNNTLPSIYINIPNQKMSLVQPSYVQHYIF